MEQAREVPEWNNGGPINLTAAALDSLEWLLLMRRLLASESSAAGMSEQLRRDAIERLDRCIASLKHYTGEA